jgi:hypothetical protein
LLSMEDASLSASLTAPPAAPTELKGSDLRRKLLGSFFRA